MSPDSKTSKAVLLILAFSLTIGAASADTPNITIENDDQIWRQANDDVLNATVYCKEDVEKVILRSDPLGTQAHTWGADGDNSKFEIEYPIFDKLGNPMGEYRLEATCGGTDPSPKSFSVGSMRLSLEDVFNGDTWYIGQENRFKVDFGSQGADFEKDNLALVNFTLVNDDNRQTREKEVTDLNENNVLSTLGINWDGFLNDQDSADATLKVDAFYNNSGEIFRINSDHITRSITLNKWRVTNVEVRPDDSVTVSQFNQLGLTADIYYKGNPVNRESDSFGPDNFYLKGYSRESGDSQWFEGELINKQKGRYSISLGPTPKVLESPMTVVFDSELSNEPVEVAEVTIEDIQKFVWSAKVLTPEQNADTVEADFRVSYEDSFVNFTSTNGDFSQKIRPGDHDLEVEFPTSRLSLYDVELNENKSGRNILYNYVYYSGIEGIQGAEKLEGIKPVNLASYSFAYPFEDGHLEMRFNNEQMDSSESVKVFECTQWHFGDKKCKSADGWQEVSGVRTIPASWMNTKYSTAIFDIQPHDSTDNGDILQNAYIVGTSADLMLNNDLRIRGAGSDGRVETSGDITIKQSIVSENGNTVEGAEVEVSLYRGETEIKSFDTVETGPEGGFTVKGEVPNEPGNYTIRVAVEASNYNDLETEMSEKLEVYVAEGVGVDVESPLEVTLGQEVSTTVEVVNTGQTEMNDVELTFSGLNSDFYTVSRKNFASIDAGESRTVEVTFDIPESYGVENYPELGIEVSAQNDEGEGFTDADSIQTQLTYGSSGTGSAESESPDEESKESSSFSPSDAAEMTGEFLDSQSSLNIALGLILVFMMALAGAVKKKKNQEDDDRRRGGRPAVQKPSVQNGDSKPQEEDEEDVDSQIDEIADAFDEEEQEESEESGGDIDEVAEGIEDDADAEPEEDEAEQEAGEEGPGSFKCEVCGEEFDSESGRDLHRQALHE